MFRSKHVHRFSLVSQGNGKSKPANTACTRLGVRTAFFELFLASAESRFGGESTLPPQAGNASRWALATYYAVRATHKRQ